MIVFLTTQIHTDTVASLVDGSYGAALPELKSLPYEAVLLADTLPRATYVFSDIERLSLWEKILAAELHRKLQNDGCRCLNDPAQVMTRYSLLRALHHAGINPFRVWRLDDAILAGMLEADPPTRSRWRRAPAPRPPNFPVFLRTDADHDRPLTDPLPTRASLADAVARLGDQGVPLSGVMIIEYCSEPLADGVWGKFGTFRIGDMISVDHAVIERNWCVRTGTVGIATAEMFEWEHRAVATNAYAAALKPAFAVGGIEYGRADHATVGGRQVIYEINTNPFVASLAPQRLPIRDETMRVGHDRFATGLHAIDGATGEPVRIAKSPRAERQLLRGNVPAMLFRP